MKKDILAFVDRLAQAKTQSNAYNQYAPDNAYNEIRRQNLIRYLEQMLDYQPSAALVMEAPGYRGARLTGVPVTSRRLLMDVVPELKLFGAANGYVDIPEPGFEQIRGEQTASIVWSTLSALGQPAVIWNAFPFHPYQPESPLTNRTPRSGEIAQGAPFLAEIFDLFRCPLTIAVGNVAAGTLQNMGVQVVRVRHPAQGGKPEFVRGISAALGNQSRR